MKNKKSAYYYNQKWDKYWQTFVIEIDEKAVLLIAQKYLSFFSTKSVLEHWQSKSRKTIKTSASWNFNFWSFFDPCLSINKRSIECLYLSMNIMIETWMKWKCSPYTTMYQKKSYKLLEIDVYCYYQH